jgi:hypothetical protein
LIVNENGLNAPPPPVIVTLAVAIGLQAGCGLGLGEGLALGEGLGLGDGLGVWASISAAPMLRKIAPRAMTTHWIQSGRLARRAWGDFAA